MSESRRRAGRARPEARRALSFEEGIAVNWATGLPRSVMVTVSPPAATVTTAEAFCLRARMPTSAMCFIEAPLVSDAMGPAGQSGRHHFPGAVPVSLRLPEADASRLEGP